LQGGKKKGGGGESVFTRLGKKDGAARGKILVRKAKKRDVTTAEMREKDRAQLELGSSPMRSLRLSKRGQKGARESKGRGSV